MYIDKWKYIVAMWAIFWAAILIFTYMRWSREYDSKIISINRYIYTIKLENGKSLYIVKDDKELE